MLNVSDAEIDFFKADVQKYNTIEQEIKSIKTQIKPLQEKLRELTKARTEKQQEVIQFMATNELDACNTDDATFEVRNTKVTKPISKGDVYDRIYKFFCEEVTKYNLKDQEQIAKKLHDYIYVEGREKAEKQSLKTK